MPDLSLSPVKYTAALLLPPLGLLGLEAGGVWMFGLPLFAFGVVPFIELFWTGTTRNRDAADESAAKRNPIYEAILYAIVPMQVGIMVYMMHRVSTTTPSGWELAGIISSVGLAAGVFGINVGHELGHRKTWFEQTLAKIMLLSTLYMHFFIEHNRGHHVRVATPDDPASARWGETVYGFWVRSIWRSWISAWGLEARRLRRHGKNPWTLRNQMLRFQLYQGATLAAIYAGFGTTALLCFLATSSIGILLLETVNYLEHYGLTRSKNPQGKYEGVRPAHSWNSNHPWSRILLFEVTRHSDHHTNAARKYQILRHLEKSPELPTGYPGMMMLSLVPPLWFRTMHPILARYHSSLGQPVRSSGA